MATKDVKLRVVQIHPFCAHYTVGLFEELSERMDAKFCFYSDGQEWFWPKEHGVSSGKFDCEYLPGFRLSGGRVAPSLFWKLLMRPADAIVSSIDGKFAMPMAYAAARLKGKPFLLWSGIWSRIETRFHRSLFFVTRYFYRHADAIVVYGEHVKRYLIEEGVPAERIFVAPHSVDNERYGRDVTCEEKQALRDRLGIGTDKKVVLFLGRLEAVKGVDYLIDAFAKLSTKDAVLVIAGEGSQRVRLEALVESKRIQERVRFTGYVPVEEAIVFHSIAHVCVLPSVTTPEVKELWGLVANEAFNQGVPVIATDAVGAAVGGLVQDAMNGKVVPERDAEQLGEAIACVLGDDIERQRLSAGARRAIAGWTHGRMADAFEEAVRYAVESRRSRSRAAERAPMPQTTKCTTSCPLCGNSTPPRAVGAFRKCDDCGLLFRHPMPTIKELRELYKESWTVPREHCDETGGTTTELAVAYVDRLVESLGRNDLNGLRILDYGAGKGELAQALSKRGADVHALEPYGAQYLRERGFQAYSSIEGLPAGTVFNGIVTVDVVEHEVAAWEILGRLRQLLAEDGWLYLATPNPDGLNARVFRGRWREAQKSGHLLFFAPRTLERILQTAGFAHPRRLLWNVPYDKSFVVRIKDFILSALRLDGELRYLAFRTRGESR